MVAQDEFLPRWQQAGTGDNVAGRSERVLRLPHWDSHGLSGVCGGDMRLQVATEETSSRRNEIK